MARTCRSERPLAITIVSVTVVRCRTSSTWTSAALSPSSALVTSCNRDFGPFFGLARFALLLRGAPGPAGDFGRVGFFLKGFGITLRVEDDLPNAVGHEELGVAARAQRVAQVGRRDFELRHGLHVD